VAVDLAQAAVTALASAVGALAAAAFGYRYALAKHQRERTFDKQLAWYEKATAALIDAANRLNWAMAAEVAAVSIPDQQRAWSEALSSLVSLRGLEAESEMYATPESHTALSEAVADVTGLARAIWVIGSRGGSRSGAQPVRRLYEICFKLLYHAASRLATDVRTHLALPEIAREWRLYDEEYRRLRGELAELRERGQDFNDGAWPLSESPSAPRPQPTDGAAAV
jgi:hypothetical protein